MLTVILPCAGEGSRLGLPYPKEMHQIASDCGLVDLSLRLIYPHRHLISRVVVVSTPRKAAIYDYLGKWRSKFTLCFMYFNDQHVEWPGSVLSAEPLFSDRNLVLLPDSRITEHPDRPVVPVMDRMLADTDLVLAVKKDASLRLRHLGAVRLDDDGRITDFQDKPDGQFDRFNGFWTAFGFRGNAGRAILETFMRSVQRYPVSLANVLDRPAQGFEVDDYLDLGTWENISILQSANR